LGSLFIKLYQIEHVLPDETANRTGAVYSDGNRAIRPYDIAGTVKNLPLFFIETAG
jgi:hypothetical protein